MELNFQMIIGLVLAASAACGRAKPIDRLSLFGVEKTDHSLYPVSRLEYNALAQTVEEKLQSSEIKEGDIFGLAYAVEELLKQQKQDQEKKSKNILQRLMHLGEKNQLTEDAVELFSNLAPAMTDCNQESFTEIKDNFRLAIGDSDYLKPTNRLNRAILFVMQRNGQICRPSYLKQFLHLIRSTRKSLMADVDRLFDPKLLQELLPQAANLRELIHMGREQIAAKLLGNPRPLFDRVIELAKESGETYQFVLLDEGTLSYHIPDRDRFRHQTVQNHLVVPCGEYVSSYARVFSKARFSLALDDSKIHEITQGNEQFSDSWTRYRICEAIWLNGDKISKAISQVN